MFRWLDRFDHTEDIAIAVVWFTAGVGFAAVLARLLGLI